MYECISCVKAEKSQSNLTSGPKEKVYALVETNVHSQHEQVLHLCSFGFGILTGTQGKEGEAMYHHGYQDILF